MLKIDFIEEKVKELKKYILAPCIKMDSFKKGVYKYGSRTGNEKMIDISLNLVNLFIASTNGINNDEVELYNSISSKKYTHQELFDIYEKMGIDEENFANVVPVLLKALVDYDNDSSSVAENKLYSLAFYELVAYVGIYMVMTDSDADDEELNKITKYLRTMYDYILENSTCFDLEIQEPFELLDDINREMHDRYVIDDDYDKDDESSYLSSVVMSSENNTVDNGNGAKSSNKGNEEETLEELIHKLYSMIGLDQVKDDVTSLMSLLRVKELREKMGLKMPPVTMHLVFTGNPGTGKTTVARLLAKIYNKLGVLSKGHLVEVDRSGLVGGYVGQTALKVESVVASALGGVLFIDEAYSLIREGINSNDYGFEAVDTLVKCMEDHREDLVVIVAGYTKQMQSFLCSNPGLKSRFNKYIEFENYTPIELKHIFLKFCDDNGYRSSKPLEEHIYNHFKKRCEFKDDSFANAREVRNIFESIITNQSNRIIQIQNPSKDNLSLLKLEDAVAPKEELGFNELIADSLFNGQEENKWFGVSKEDQSIKIDELEFTPKTEAFLSSIKIKAIKDYLRFVEKGNNLKDKGASDIIYNEIINEFKKYGYDGE